MEKIEKQKLVNSHSPWWHSIDFGDGVVSPGKKTTENHKREEKYFTPDFFNNKRVLDVGCWDGYYSFYAERQGAKEVVASDGRQWRLGNKSGFDIAKKILNSNVKETFLDINEPGNTELGGKFDSIMFLGVIYHLKNPYHALEMLDSLLNPNGQLIIETTLANETFTAPLMEFHPRASLDKDATNFWSPNTTCLCKMLQEISNYTLLKKVILNRKRGYIVVRKG